MRSIVRVIALASCLTGILLGSAGGAEEAVSQPAEKAGAPAAPATAVETSFAVTDRYTAQRRPRVTVLAFEDTNSNAQSTLYGSSVEAMLVTFLKRKSQFVVVERQDEELKRLFNEKRRLQGGMVSVNPDSRESLALLERIDVFVLGSVTLLEHVPPQDPPGVNGTRRSPNADDPDESLDEEDAAEGEASARARRLQSIPGPRIEIDVKLISRFDGRIIAAAQRSGPVACLRSIVERLGIALEQEFLRPYYGKLTVNLDEPEHIRVFLTPILPENALDEEKPPVELGTTVTINSDHDVVEPWTTDPTTYTIRNVLSGWYSMRIERPGYSPIGIENARWEVRKRLGREIVYDRVSNRPSDKIALADRHFLVRVDPLTTEVIDGNALKFTFRKEGGSIGPVVKRQYLDDGFAQAPQRIVLIGGEEIDLNMLERPDEYADDPRCDFFDERKPRLANYGRTYIASGQTFNFDQFTGGELIIDDYKGEVVPAGVYKMAVWEPSYRTERGEVRVRDRDEKKPIKISLTRETAGLALETTGPRPANRVVLEGRETRHRIELPLDFADPMALRGIPVDEYLTSTNISDLDGWTRNAVAPASNVMPPTYDTKSEKNAPLLIEAPLPTEEPMSRVGVKTRFGLAGRLDALSRRPDPLAADLFIDEGLLKILNLLLYGTVQRPGEERGDFWKAAAEAGRIVAPNGNNTVGLKLQASNNTGLLEYSMAATGGAGLAASEKPQPADPFPRDPDLLRKLLAERLELIDLVILDPVDMVQLRRSPEVAAILARYVASGGSLFAYVSSVGDYRQILGIPFVIETLSKRTRRLDLAPGEVEGLIPKLTRKEVKVKARRALPEVGELPAPWRTLAYTRGGRRPRIVERGGEEGGYVALWLDDPEAFRSRWGGTRPKVEEARARVEEHIFQKSQAVMHRRFDRLSQAEQPCAAPVASP